MENESLKALAESGKQSFGRRVAKLRKAAGLTQGDLAERMSQGGRSYAQSTIAKIEKATRPTSVEELYMLALILEVDVADLVSRTGLDAELVEADRTIAETQVQLHMWQSRVEELRQALAALIHDRDQIAADIRAEQDAEEASDGVDQ